MIIPVGARDTQELVLVKKSGLAVTEEKVEGEVTFVPLLGRFAWNDEAGG
jgi:protein-L-isoaspartate O-methyltransferase